MAQFQGKTAFTVALRFGAKSCDAAVTALRERCGNPAAQPAQSRPLLQPADADAVAVVGGIVLPVADGFLRRCKTAVLITAKQRGMGAETVRQRKIKAAVAAVVAVGAVGFAVVVAVMLERCVKLACRRKTQAVRCLKADAVRQHIGGDAAVVFRFAVKFAAAGKLCLVKRQ